MWDGGNGRILIFDSVGVPVRTARGPEDLPLFRLRGGDGEGFLYFEGVEIAQPTVPLLRWHVASGLIDTVTMLQAPSVAIGSSSTSAGTTTFSFPNPYSPADAWRVTADGRVVVTRASPYRIEIFGGRALLSRGPAYDVEQIPITDEDRARHRGMAEFGAEFEWPDTKAPFPHDRITLLNDTLLVVTRTAAPTLQWVEHDVFDLRGTRVGSFRTDPVLHILASSGDYVLTARRDADDLYQIEAHTISRP